MVAGLVAGGSVRTAMLFAGAMGFCSTSAIGDKCTEAAAKSASASVTNEPIRGTSCCCCCCASPLDANAPLPPLLPCTSTAGPPPSLLALVSSSGAGRSGLRCCVCCCGVAMDADHCIEDSMPGLKSTPRPPLPTPPPPPTALPAAPRLADEDTDRLPLPPLSVRLLPALLNGCFEFDRTRSPRRGVSMFGDHAWLRDRGGACVCGCARVCTCACVCGLRVYTLG